MASFCAHLLPCQGMYYTLRIWGSAHTMCVTPASQLHMEQRYSKPPPFSYLFGVICVCFCSMWLGCWPCAQASISHILCHARRGTDAVLSPWAVTTTHGCSINAIPRVKYCLQNSWVSSDEACFTQRCAVWGEEKILPPLGSTQLNSFNTRMFSITAPRAGNYHCLETCHMFLAG